MSSFVVPTTNSLGFHLQDNPCAGPSRRRDMLSLTGRNTSSGWVEKRRTRTVMLSCTASPQSSIPLLKNLSIDSSEVSDESDLLIECKNIHKSFGGKKILKGVDFKVNIQNLHEPFFLILSILNLDLSTSCMMNNIIRLDMEKLLVLLGLLARGNLQSSK